MPSLIPAILVKDAETFRERLKIVEGVVRCVQLDCMDGHFVPNRTWYEAGPIDTTLEIELDLLVTDPLAVIRDWKRAPQVIRAFWHVELDIDHAKVIETCRSQGWECGLSISPETPIERLAPYHSRIDAVLVMGVRPGWSGQNIISSTIESVRRIKTQWPELTTGFDGGATLETIPDILAAGADRICSGSAIFAAPDPRAAAEGLKRLVENA
jgi:ribulose-phosphate 3-epimerase